MSELLSTMMTNGNIDSIDEAARAVTIQAFLNESCVAHDPAEAQFFQVCAPLFNRDERVWVADFTLYEHAYFFSHILSEKLEVSIKDLAGKTFQP